MAKQLMWINFTEKDLHMPWNKFHTSIWKTEQLWLSHLPLWWASLATAVWSQGPRHWIQQFGKLLLLSCMSQIMKNISNRSFSLYRQPWRMINWKVLWSITIMEMPRPIILSTRSWTGYSMLLLPLLCFYASFLFVPAWVQTYMIKRKKLES